MSNVPQFPRPEQATPCTVVRDPDDPHILFVATPTGDVTVVQDPECPTFSVRGADQSSDVVMDVMDALFHKFKFKYPWCDAWPCDCGETAIATQRCEWPCECVSEGGGHEPLTPHASVADLATAACLCSRVGKWWGGCSWCIDYAPPFVDPNQLTLNL